MNFFIQSAIVSGVRGRSFQAIFILGVLLVGTAYLAAQFSPRQPQAVALDVGISGMRFTGFLLALFWVQELLGREIERKTAILMLAYPISRAYYLMGRFLGIAVLLGLSILTFALLLVIVTSHAGGGYVAMRAVALGGPYWAAILGLYLDILVVTAFAVCLTALSTVLILPLAMGAAFAVITHALGPVLDFLVARQGDGDTELVVRFGPAVRVVRWLLPDLSRLDWRDWPMYQLPPEPSGLFWSVVMAIAFIGLLMVFAVTVFRRREFS
ncbi:MAG: ABC transporter permease [Rhodocyclaceae bacterium]|nr:MAG: ABC transporter permease [Rhodocyclaceae bacterium]